MRSMNSAGTKLYVVNVPFLTPALSEVVETYSYYTINAKTGGLGKTNWSWPDDFGDIGIQQSTFSDALIARLENPVGNFNINIYPNKAGVKQNAPLIKCTSKMLAACGDSGTFHPQIDPSGKYLFFGDSTINEMQIVSINTAMKKLQASGASIPGNPDALAFSPDGLLVYAIEKSEILVYVFHSGKFTAKSTIKAPGVISMLPWV
jgi:DNA-binding beta-propeller fold protein YncE